MLQRASSLSESKPMASGKILWLDRIMALSVTGLILVLPVAHTATIRAFLLAFALFAWIAKVCLKKEWNLRRTPLDLFLLLYLVTIVISLFTSLRLSSSLSALKNEFLTNVILFYLITANLHKEADSKKCMLALCVGSAVMAIYGIVDFFVKEGSLLGFNYRAGSLHQGYEAFGQYLIIVLPFNFLGIVYAARKRQGLLLSVLFVLNVFALYLTHTRGAWLAFLAEMLILSAVVLPKRLKLAGVALLVLIPAAFIFSAPEEVLWHGKPGLSLEDKDIWHNPGTIRLIMWKESLHSLKENPFKGSGYGKANFMRRFADKPFAPYEQAHNTFINTAIQLGIQGLIALVLIILAILRLSWKGWSAQGHTFQGFYFLGVFVMTIGFFTACQFAEFFIDDTASLFWILVGLAVSLHIRRSEHGAIETTLCQAR